jgi:hypothetical protein
VTAPPPPFDHLRAPGEEDARRRAWAVARAALAERQPVTARRLLARPPAAVLAAVFAVAVLALALTAPGHATATWLRERIAAVADPTPRAARPKPAPTSGPLPGGGRILVVNVHGPTVLGLPGAPRVLLGAVDDATWSPHGRYVAAVRGIELIAVDLHGRRRWHVAARHGIEFPRWAPSGFRVAYLVGGPGLRLRVVAGDGTGDRAVARAGPTPPAWNPSPAVHLLAYADPANRIVVRDIDSGAVVWRARSRERARTLAWSHDGRRLLAVGARTVTAYAGASGHVVGRRRAPHGTANVTAAFAPRGRRYVLVRHVHATGDHRLVLVQHGRERLLQVGTGPIDDVAWGPDGHWLVLDQPGGRPWSLMHLTRAGPDIPRLLAPGRGARLAGWCCS